MSQYEIEQLQFFYEEPIKKKLKPLLSTRKQVKLLPVHYTDKYRDKQYLHDITNWYRNNRNEINYIFNEFVKIFIKKKIYFNSPLNIIYDDFVEMLYYYA
tara:strand:+ start:1602 stop:1901 length:300 start_codon:yes stop_codon:yes gene_type:complete